MLAEGSVHDRNFCNESTDTESRTPLFGSNSAGQIGGAMGRRAQVDGSVALDAGEDKRMSVAESPAMAAYPCCPAIVENRGEGMGEGFSLCSSSAGRVVKDGAERCPTASA